MPLLLLIGGWGMFFCELIGFSTLYGVRKVVLVESGI